MNKPDEADTGLTLVLINIGKAFNTYPKHNL